MKDKSKIPPHIVNVCKIGQGHDCCRYLGAGTKGLECLKIIPEFKRMVDARVHGYTAKSDNCEGKTIEELNRMEE